MKTGGRRRKRSRGRNKRELRIISGLPKKKSQYNNTINNSRNLLWTSQIDSNLQRNSSTTNKSNNSTKSSNQNSSTNQTSFNSHLKSNLIKDLQGTCLSTSFSLNTINMKLRSRGRWRSLKD